MSDPGWVAGTSGGIHTSTGRVWLEGREIAHLARADGDWWAVGGRTLWRREGGAEWAEVGRLEGRAQFVTPTRSGIFVGASEAHLFRLEDGDLTEVGSFQEVEGRQDWFTPWGGPPAARSVAESSDGALYVNVHVGGLPRSRDGGRTWQPTVDIYADIHQVIVHPQQPELILAAAARGLALSPDGGDTWSFETRGLHATYCRALVICGQTLLLTASSGPYGGRAAIYRRPADARAPFERCTQGLPEWFDRNIDSHCLAASGPTAAFGTEEGNVYLSEDEGRTWARRASGLPAVRCLLLT